MTTFLKTDFVRKIKVKEGYLPQGCLSKPPSLARTDSPCPAVPFPCRPAGSRNGCRECRMCLPLLTLEGSFIAHFSGCRKEVNPTTYNINKNGNKMTVGFNFLPLQQLRFVLLLLDLLEKTIQVNKTTKL